MSISNQTPLTAASKTNSLLRMDVAINSLEPNELNPNQMTDAEFNMLYDNIERMGVTDPILVRIHPTKPDMYRIVGGYHRWEVAKLHGMDTVPVTVITDPAFDEDMEKFQIVRHNIIHGSMTPDKFMKLYQSLSTKYSNDIAAEMFGFTDEGEFKKLLQLTAKTLPPEMIKDFKAATKEIKTVDDLSMVLNRLFTTYGDSIPFNYMIFDYGNQDHIWLRMQKSQKKDFEHIAFVCKQKRITMDGYMTLVLQLIAQGKFTPEDLEEGLSKLPIMDIPENMFMPTEDGIIKNLV